MSIQEDQRKVWTFVTALVISLIVASWFKPWIRAGWRGGALFPISEAGASGSITATCSVGLM